MGHFFGNSHKPENKHRRIETEKKSCFDEILNQSHIYLLRSVDCCNKKKINLKSMPLKISIFYIITMTVSTKDALDIITKINTRFNIDRNFVIILMKCIH